MKFLKNFTIVVTLSSLTLQVQAHTKVNSPIISITSEPAFTKALASKTPTMIMLYMQNCPHCNTIKGKNEESLESSWLQEFANNHAINVYIANGQELKAHTILEKKHNIKIPGYPTFLFIKNGKVASFIIGGNKNLLHMNAKKLLSKN